jgi:hypothetical protein
MNREAIKTWIAALRSGKFKQHRGSLTNEWNTAFCCLGVGYLCVVEASVVDMGEPGDYALIQKAFGFGDTITKTLITMNDTRYKSFSEIADFLEGLISEPA